MALVHLKVKRTLYPLFMAFAVCSLLPIYFDGLYCKQYGPRSDCSLSLILNYLLTTADSSMKSSVRLTDDLHMTSC